MPNRAVTITINSNDRDHASMIADHGYPRQLFGPRSMLTGCQRRSAVFCSTDGLTQLTGHIPDNTSDNS